jgi:hypothetical protein
MAPSALLKPAVAAFRSYSRWYGQYPRPTVAVVEIGPAGYSQEFSGLVFIAPDVSAPRYVAHEIAHLWWFDLVGSDQILDPFLDEALAEYSSRVVSHVDDPSCSTRPLGVTVFAFKPEKKPAQERSCKGYFRTIYRRGALFWHDAQRLLGTNALRRALRDFVTAHRFGLVDTATLLDAVEAAAPSRAADLRALEAEYGLRGPVEPSTQPAWATAGMAWPQS